MDLGIRKKVQQFIGLVDNISFFGQLLQWNGQMLLHEVLSSIADNFTKYVEDSSANWGDCL